MRLGYFLPQMGSAASPENLVRVAERAEQLGFGTVWVTERLLYPLAPQTPYAGTPDGSLPDVYKTVLDPIGSLTYVAAKTSKVGLGTSVLDMPYYNPVLLARQLTTLDIMSGGRLRVGLGLGWSKDEHDATKASLAGRGKLADEFLDVLHKIWKDDPVEHNGKYFTVPKSIIQPKPAQKPHPPVYLAAFSPGALRRVAQHADGWHPVALPVDAMRGMWAGVQSMAKEFGRDPSTLELIVRGNLEISKEPLGEGRFIFSGSADEIKADIAACRELGANEVCLDPGFSEAGKTVEGFLSTMEQVRELAS
jgi:probable F420-dependent oxidoreductase